MKRDALQAKMNALNAALKRHAQPWTPHRRRRGGPRLGSINLVLLVFNLLPRSR